MRMAILLACIASLLGVSVLAVVLRRRKEAVPAVYGACAVLSSVLSVVALSSIAAPPTSAVLPLSLPWLGAHLRVDSLTAAFLTIVNVGATGASVYGLGLRAP